MITVILPSPYVMRRMEPAAFPSPSRTSIFLYCSGKILGNRLVESLMLTQNLSAGDLTSTSASRVRGPPISSRSEERNMPETIKVTVRETNQDAHIYYSSRSDIFTRALTLVQLPFICLPLQYHKFATIPSLHCPQPSCKRLSVRKCMASVCSRSNFQS